MGAEDRIVRARERYEEAVYGGEDAPLDAADRDLDAVEADLALARGRLVHTRFNNARNRGGPVPAEDPTELPLFERAAALYRSLGDERGEGEAVLWIGLLHQVIRRDNDTAVPHLERSADLSRRTGDPRTRSEALRHLGIAAHSAGRLDEARRLLEESTALRREIGLLSGAASNMVGLAYIAAADGRREDAAAILTEARAIAGARHAHAILHHIEEAEAALAG